jgi:hypothetical protein
MRNLLDIGECCAELGRRASEGESARPRPEISPRSIRLQAPGTQRDTSNDRTFRRLAGCIGSRNFCSGAMTWAANRWRSVDWRELTASREFLPKAGNQEGGADEAHLWFLNIKINQYVKSLKDDSLGTDHASNGHYQRMSASVVAPPRFEPTMYSFRTVACSTARNFPYDMVAETTIGAFRS